MKAILRRLRILEASLATTRNEQGLSLADVLRELQCRRVAQERGVPYEEVLREHIIEHQAFWAHYVGDGTIAGTLRYARRRRLEAAAAAQNKAQSL